MKPNSKRPRQAGFALIVTLSLMILLTVIAVGLLTLSTISLRASSQTQATSVARSNARLAMMLALGELQTAMGVDRAVSAPASSVVVNGPQPHLTGTWNAIDPAEYWHWTPVPNSGPQPQNKKAQFKRWLVSSPQPTDAEAFSFANSPPPSNAAGVMLVGDLDDSQNVSTKVMAGKVPLATSQRGGYGWAVFDESTKAAVDLGDPPVKQDPGLEIATRVAPFRLRADAIADGNKLASLATPVNLVTLETASIMAPNSQDEFRRRFHDLTTNTMGLLTNTADGGLKTDLTALFEPNSIPTGAFASPTEESPYQEAFAVTSGAPKWEFLQNHYQKYRSVTTSGGGETSYSLASPSSKDLKVNPSAAGVNAAPDYERLLPILAKFQLVFSLVAHPNHVGDRVAFFNANGGNQNFGAIHLVYDPIITLYNPYDVSLYLRHTRIRVWDPPVGFRFTKIDRSGSRAFFRQGGEFHGLARLQIANQNNTSARKCFTLLLTDGTSEAAGSTLRLKPGEVKVFSPRVEKRWNWGFEIAGGYDPRSFFDWNAGLDFGNVDRRTMGKPGGRGEFGIEAVPGWDPRAGLQTDHLSYGGSRPADSMYPFERNANRSDGFVNINLADRVQVEARAAATSATAVKQFQVDVLAGNVPGSSYTDPNNTSVRQDTLRSYTYTFAGGDPTAEISEDPKNPIRREFSVGALLQGMTDMTSEKKKPFAMLEMTARTTKGALTDSKPWLYNNPVVEGADQNSNSVGLANQSYDLRLIEISSLKGFPNGISIDPSNNHGYFGASDSLEDGGSSFVPMMHVPVAPAASLGDLVPSNLASSSHSFLLNDSLWDSYFFSSVTDYVGGAGKVLQGSRSMDAVLRGIFSGEQPALNTRLVPVRQTDPADTAKMITELSDLDRSRQLAKHLGVSGPFNLNSTSVDAWKAVLMSLRGREINGLNVGYSGAPPNQVATVSSTPYTTGDTTPFVRMSKPLAGPNPPDDLRWAGFRTLTDKEIETLAKSIVTEIQASGVHDEAPAFSLGEFVNRRPGSAGELHSLAGVLQTAIDNSGINDDALDEDSIDLSPNFASRRMSGIRNRELMSGKSADGAPTVLTQGDLMMALAPIAKVRGDTFKIRSYGEATSKNGAILARAWCETVVQRLPEFVDPVDAPETPVALLTATSNRTFGRRFQIVGFRWLNESEL